MTPLTCSDEMSTYMSQSATKKPPVSFLLIAGPPSSAPIPGVQRLTALRHHSWAQTRHHLHAAVAFVAAAECAGSHPTEACRAAAWA